MNAWIQRLQRSAQPSVAELARLIDRDLYADLVSTAAAAGMPPARAHAIVQAALRKELVKISIANARAEKLEWKYLAHRVAPNERWHDARNRQAWYLPNNLSPAAASKIKRRS